MNVSKLANYALEATKDSGNAFDSFMIIKCASAVMVKRDDPAISCSSYKFPILRNSIQKPHESEPDFNGYTEQN